MSYFLKKEFDNVKQNWEDHWYTDDTLIPWPNYPKPYPDYPKYPYPKPVPMPSVTFTPFFEQVSKMTTFPLTNIIDDKNEYTIKLVVPSYNKDEIKIELSTDGNGEYCIKVSGSKTQTKTTKYKKTEFTINDTFSSIFTLSNFIDFEKSPDIVLESGILTIKFLKKKQNEPIKLEIK
jgi:HSP20 family molecular chaperone IbpA